MIDITSVGTDIGLNNTDNFRAKNILSVQVGNLEYAPDLGIDLAYFLSEDFKFQNESFKAYLVQVLANNAINVASVLDTVNNLFEQYTFNLSPTEGEGGMVAR